MPIYKTRLADGPARLVKASNIAAAKAHVLKPLVVECEVVTTEEAVDLAMAGVRIETAGEEAAQAEVEPAAATEAPATLKPAFGRAKVKEQADG